MADDEAVAALEARFRSEVADAVALAMLNRATGVLPLELRNALMAIRRRTEHDLHVLGRAERAPSDAGTGPDARIGRPAAIAALAAELEKFVDREMRDFIAKTRPAPTLGGIFANAQMSTVKYDEAKDGVKSKKCGCCGAARPEGTDLRTCAFCGHDLFPAGT